MAGHHYHYQGGRSAAEMFFFHALWTLTLVKRRLPPLTRSVVVLISFNRVANLAALVVFVRFEQVLPREALHRNRHGYGFLGGSG